MFSFSACRVFHIFLHLLPFTLAQLTRGLHHELTRCALPHTTPFGLYKRHDGCLLHTRRGKVSRNDDILNSMEIVRQLCLIFLRPFKYKQWEKMACVFDNLPARPLQQAQYRKTFLILISIKSRVWQRWWHKRAVALVFVRGWGGICRLSASTLQN